MRKWKIKIRIARPRTKLELVCLLQKNNTNTTKIAIILLHRRCKHIKRNKPLVFKTTIQIKFSTMYSKKKRRRKKLTSSSMRSRLTLLWTLIQQLLLYKKSKIIALLNIS
jgi:hypothetical protein